MHLPTSITKHISLFKFIYKCHFLNYTSYYKWISFIQSFFLSQKPVGNFLFVYNQYHNGISVSVLIYKDLYSLSPSAWKFKILTSARLNLLLLGWYWFQKYTWHLRNVSWSKIIKGRLVGSMHVQKYFR